MQDKAFANEKISFEWNAEVDEIKDAGKGVVTSMVLRSNLTGAVKEIAVDGVFVAIGHTPNTALFRGQLDTDPNGYILTHSGTRTSMPGRDATATALRRTGVSMTQAAFEDFGVAAASN